MPRQAITTIWAVIALTCAAVVGASRHLTQASTEVKICIPTSANQTVIDTCSKAIAAANTQQVSFSCVLGGSTEACSAMLKAGTASLTRMGATDLYKAHQDNGFVPVVAEIYTDPEGASYYAVAVVPSSMCSASGVTLASLAGKRSCHTGYGRTAGWAMPVGLMAEDGVIPVVSSQSGVRADAQSVASFFSQTCAPGTNDNGPMDGGKSWDKLCTACKGDCSATDPYADYSGALRCLMEGAGDVAFTKHNIPLENAKDGSAPQAWSSLNKSQLRLLCPTGGCAPLDDFASCNLARVPAGALVAPSDLQASQLGRDIQAALVAAAANKTSFLNSTKPSVFSASTQSIKAHTSSFASFYSSETLQALAGARRLQTAAATPSPTPTPGSSASLPTDVKLCIPIAASDAFVAACTKAMSAANTAAVKFSCVPGGSADDCGRMIQSGQAQITRLGATQQYNAYEEFGLEPIVTELFRDVGDASYFSVAVVPASMCSASGVSLASLAGKRSCHTGYGRTAGWVMPTGYMAETGVIPVVSSQSGVRTDAQSVASFFSQTCAPGTNDNGPMDGGKSWDKLCTACKGDCSATDPYADYSGALRCLMEGAGDVAFTKHNIPLENARDGSAPQAWSSLNKSQLRLLCPSGGCAPLDDFASCNLARVPAGALVAPPDMKSSQLGRDIQAALVAAAEKDGSFLSSTKSLMGASNFIFSSAAEGLAAQNKSFEAFFTPATIEAIKGQQAMAASSSAGTGAPRPSSDSSASGSSGSGGVSSGAAAGIGIGCAIAGALIAAAISVFVYRRKAAYAPHMDEGVRVAPGLTPSTHSDGKPYV